VNVTGARAVIGALEDMRALLDGKAGTQIVAAQQPVRAGK